MIEIIYSENKEEKTAVFPVKLPRNFRQIGSGEDYRKVYIEDYVMTYIHKLWEQDKEEYQAGVLMGSCKKYGGETYLFISGAVRAEGIEQEGSGLKFTDKVWTDLYEKIKQYFNSLEIVGWFYARNDSVKEIEEGLFKTHVDNFGGVDKVLFLIDKKEKEEEFYGYENGQLARLLGYYVYYEKNEQMQEYMVEQAPNESVDEQNDDRVTSNYRLLVQEKQDTNTKKKLSSTLYTACTCLVIAILAAGTLLVRDYDRMQQIESQVRQLAVSVLKQESDTVSVEQVKGDVYPTEAEKTDTQTLPAQGRIEVETKTGETTQTDTTKTDTTKTNTTGTNGTETNGTGTNGIGTNGTGTNGTGTNGAGTNGIETNGIETNGIETNGIEAAVTETTAQATTETTLAESTAARTETVTEKASEENSSLSEGNSTEAATVVGIQNTSGKAGYYYTVQKGETLTSICIAVYQSDWMVPAVKEANGIEDGDKIYPGQEIYLP